MKKIIFLFVVFSLFYNLKIYSQTNSEKSILELINKVRSDSSSRELEWNDDYYSSLNNIVQELNPPKNSTNVEVNDYLSKIYYKIDNSRVTSYYGYFENLKGGKYEDIYILKNLQSHTTQNIFTKESDEVSVKKWTLKSDNKELIFYYVLLINQLEY